MKKDEQSSGSTKHLPNQSQNLLSKFNFQPQANTVDNTQIDNKYFGENVTNSATNNAVSQNQVKE